MKQFKQILMLSIIFISACEQTKTNSKEKTGIYENNELPQKDTTKKRTNAKKKDMTKKSWQNDTTNNINT